MSAREVRRIGVRSYVVLRTIMVFNTLILLFVAGLLGVFMEHPAGLLGAGACCLAAGMTLGGARWLDKLYRRG